MVNIVGYMGKICKYLVIPAIPWFIWDYEPSFLHEGFHVWPNIKTTNIGQRVQTARDNEFGRQIDENRRFNIIVMGVDENHEASHTDDIIC